MKRKRKLRRARILRLADYIGELTDERFDMSTTGIQYYAGLPEEACSRCIMGHALILFPPKEGDLDRLGIRSRENAEAGDLFQRARAVLGLSKKESLELFTPTYPTADWCSEKGEESYITIPRAVAVLRRLACLGTVDWEATRQS